MNEIWVLIVISCQSEPVTLSADDIVQEVELFYDYETAKATLHGKRKELASYKNFNIDLRKANIH